jgi:hypothetical protein
MNTMKVHTKNGIEERLIDYIETAQSSILETGRFVPHLSHAYPVLNAGEECFFTVCGKCHIIEKGISK